LAWSEKAEFDRAIEDYNEAIGRAPADDLAYAERGIAWRGKGEFDNALTDITEAIRLNPKNARYYRARGYTFYYRGDFSAAAADFEQALAIKAEMYAMLWRFLARERQGRDATTELAQNATGLSTTDWPYAVIEFYLGRRSKEGLHAAASSPDEQCEVQFYLGEWLLIQGDRSAGTAALKTAKQTCSKSAIEFEGAFYELKRISQQP
jgi:lipoprotein NlpI